MRVNTNLQAPLLYCRAGCCSHPTFKSRRVDGMQAKTHLYCTVEEGTARILPLRIEGRVGCESEPTRTLLYFTVQKGVARIFPLRVKARVGCESTPTRTHLYWTVKEGAACIPPSRVGGRVGRESTPTCTPFTFCRGG